MKNAPGLLKRGMIAGIFAAIALAVWFVLIDSLQGQPLATPAFLAGALLGIGDGSVAVAPVAVYTVVHLLFFALLGVAMAWAAESAELAPGPLLGVALGFLLFDLMFYGSLLVTGRAVVPELGWLPVLTGSVVAGLVLFGALGAMSDTRPVSWAEMLAQHRTLREGIITGLIGATAVAVWFLVIDLIAGRLLFTPAALGSALFLGARGIAAVEISLGVVLGYTLVHVTAFILVGCLAALVVVKAEEEAEVLLLGAILVFVTFEAFFVGMLAIVSNWLVAELAVWSLATANVIAALSMGMYLYLKHPALMHDLQHRDLEEDLAAERHGTPHVHEVP
jgi:hypothetical protein